MSKLSNLIAALALGVFGIGGAGLGLHELSRETSAARPPVLFVFDTSEDGQAKTAVNLALKTKDYAKAKQLDRSALSISAYNTYARLRLADIDVKEHGTLTALGERELALSYDLAPYDPFAASWRVRFALDHWGDLSPSTRNAVHTEAVAFVKSGSGVADMRNTLTSVRSEEGQMLAAIWLIEAS